MSKAIIILGNGFDIDLGLKTRYSDFAKSSQWAGLMMSNDNSQNNSMLLGFLKNKYDVNRWIDIEAALLEYALSKTRAKDFAAAKEDAEDFSELCRALKDYLKSQQDNFRPETHTVAAEFLKGIADITGWSRLYSFNYTMLNDIAERFKIAMEISEQHIHGSLADDDDIILGIETTENIDDRYTFLFKTQSRHYRHSDLLKDLKGKDEYVFYGHSLNGMDYAYFRDTFMSLAVGGRNTPRLTIITKDLASENMFKIFLRNRGVSLQGLYSNADPVFILTDLVYQHDSQELKKVEDLLNRASTW